MPATSVTGAPMVQNATIEAVSTSPCWVIWITPSSTLALMRMPSSRISTSGNENAKGINTIMVAAIAIRRVIDQSRPLRISALQRGQ